MGARLDGGEATVLEMEQDALTIEAEAEAAGVTWSD